MRNKKKISFKGIVSNDFSVELHFPIYCTLTTIEDGFVFENDDLGLFSFGDTIEEAKGELFDQFRFIYEKYNELDESLLSEDVINIKNYLNKLVKN